FLCKNARCRSNRQAKGENRRQRPNGSARHSKLHFTPPTPSSVVVSSSVGLFLSLFVYSETICAKQPGILSESEIVKVAPSKPFIFARDGSLAKGVAVTRKPSTS